MVEGYSDASLPLDPEFDLGLPERRKYREAGIDIEASSLAGDGGQMLAWCVKPLGEKPITGRLDDPRYAKKRKQWEDRPLVEDLLDCISECNRIFGWYIDRYDLPMIRTRRVFSGIKETINVRKCDLFFVARRNFRMHNNRLQSYMDTFSAHKKTPLRIEVWRRALFCDKVAMDEVVEHCVEDVCGMEDVFYHVEPYIQTWSPVVL